MLRILEEHCRDVIGNFLTADGLRVVDLARCLGTAIQRAVSECMPGVTALHKWLRVVQELHRQQAAAVLGHPQRIDSAELRQ